MIKTLHEKTGSSFTELMEVTGENTGSLSFHLKKLEPLLSQDEAKKYHLNATGEKVYSALRQMDGLEASQPGQERERPEVVLAKDEKLILSSNRVKPFGQDHGIPALNSTAILHRVNATLTSRRLLLSSWRFFPPADIQLDRVKLVRIRKDIPITKGDSKGRSIEVTYSDASGNVHWVRFTPPGVEEWAEAIREACAQLSKLAS